MRENFALVNRMEFIQSGQREEIIKSQKLFWSFLDSNIINKLIHLFDDADESTDKISKYIENERIVRGLDYVSIKSIVYYDKKEKPNLLLELLNGNKCFLHITIHLSPDSFNKNRTGPIHIFKNIYRKTKRINTKDKYSLIRVSTPIGKPYSLEFSIPDGYKTPGVNTNEKQLQEEMDVIIYVINRIFDENDPYYVGDKDKLFHIHPLANTIQKNINKSQVVERKDKGVTMYPPFTNNKPYPQNTTRKTYKRTKQPSRNSRNIRLTPLNNQP